MKLMLTLRKAPDPQEAAVHLAKPGRIDTLINITAGQHITGQVLAVDGGVSIVHGG